MAELTLDDAGHCFVENFSVGREGYGNVCFTSDTDVAGLDLDAIVFIVRKELEVYPDAALKPKVGEGLNKPAVVSGLVNSWGSRFCEDVTLMMIDCRTSNYTCNLLIVGSITSTGKVIVML